jgi:hypothetical protein
VIPINVDHSKSVRDVIGSGRPFIDQDGNLRVKCTFSSGPEGQHIRSLVSEEHLRTVSVEFLRHKAANGQPVNELIGGAFVLVPANPAAVMLSAKTFSDQLQQVIKAAADGGDAAMVQAIHDAAAHLGADCMACRRMVLTVRPMARIRLSSCGRSNIE